MSTQMMKDAERAAGNAIPTSQLGAHLAVHGTQTPPRDASQPARKVSLG